MNQIERIKELMGIKHVDYLKELYNINNGNGLRRIDEITLSRVVDKHGEDGFVILSANRSDKENEENNNNKRELIQDLKKSPYSYIPAYGGYHGTDGVVDDFEPSFIVFNHGRGGEKMDFSDLKLFALRMCGKYGQDSVLIKEPGKPPYYANEDGDIVGSAKTKDVDLNDPKAEYYTSLIKSTNLDYKNPDRLKRFTYPIEFECYVHPSPNTLNELRRRKEGYGEIILEFNGKEIF